eukprot:scaffold13896_cov120-Isochrysis_galbana.AAC.11
MNSDGQEVGARIWYDPPPPGPRSGARVAPALPFKELETRRCGPCSSLSAQTTHPPRLAPSFLSICTLRIKTRCVLLNRPPPAVLTAPLHRVRHPSQIYISVPAQHLLHLSLRQQIVEQLHVRRRRARAPHAPAGRVAGRGEEAVALICAPRAARLGELASKGGAVEAERGGGGP